MADAFRGLTIRLGADARPLQSAISSVTRSASAAQRQLNRMNRALKFDKGNVAAMRSALDLVGDQATHSARAVRTIAAAMQQASGETLRFSERSGLGSRTVAEMAAKTRDAYAQTQRLRGEYTHVDAELQHIYDAVKRVYAAQENIAFAEADKHVKALQRNLAGTGDKAREARQEMQALVRSAAMNTDVASRFGFEKGIASASKLVGTFSDLRASAAALQSDLENMDKVEGFRAMRTQLIGFEADLREAAAEATRLKSELYSTGSAKGLSRALAYTRRLDGALESSTAEAKALADAYRAMPRSIEAWRAKMVSARNAAEAYRAKIGSLETVMRSIESSSSFDKTAASAENVYLAFEKAEHGATEMGAELKKVEARLEALNAERKEFEDTGFLGAGRSLEKIEKEISGVNAELAETKAKAIAADEALESAAQNKRWREASGEIQRYRAEMEGLRASASASAAVMRVGNSLRELGFGMYASVTPAITIAGRYAVQAAEDIDSAYRDMRKTVNGTEEEFEHLKQAALDFSTTHVTTAEQMLEIEAIGGQLGIAVGDLEAFAKTVSDLDIATNMDTEDIALDLAKLSNIMHFGQERYDSFADALVRLGNNEPALESDIMAISTRFAGMASNVGMATSDMLGLATAATATGQKAEAAGGSMQRTISRIEQAVAAGADELEAYARISGMTASEFAATWGDASNHGPARAIQAFVEGLKRVRDEGGSVDATLAELGINGVRDKQLLAGLANTTDVLAESLEMAGDAWNGMSTTMKDGSIEQAGDAAREAQRKSEGFSGELQMMRNNAMKLANELAEGAVPIIKSLGDMFSDLTALVGEMPQEAKTGLVVLAGALAAVGPVAVGVGTGLNFAAKALKGLTGFVPSVAMLVGKAGAQVEGLGMAMSASAGRVTKASTAVRGLGKALSAIGTTKGVAAIMGLSAYLAIVGGEFERAVERSENWAKATEGLVSAVKDTKPVLAGAKSDASGLGVQFSITAQSTEELAASQASLADEVAQRNAAAQDSIAKLQGAQDAISQYMNKTGLTAQEQARLRSAIEMVNEQCGTQYQVVDAANGKIADERGELQKTIGEIDHYIEAKKRQARADALQSNLSDLYSQESEAFKTLTDARMKYEDAVKNGDASGAAAASALTELNRAQALYDSVTTSIEMNENQLGNLVEAENKAAESIGDLAEGNVHLNSAFASSRESFTVFRDELERCGLTVKDFGSISGSQWSQIVAKWVSGGGDLADIMRSLGVQVRSTVDQYRAELSDVGMSFDDLAAKAGGSADALAGALKDAGVSAIQLADMGAEGFDKLLAVARGDIDQIGFAAGALSHFDIDPINVRVTDDGVIDTLTGKLYAFDYEAQRATDTKRVFSFQEDGSLVEITDQLDAIPEEETVTVNADIDEAEYEIEDFYDEVEGGAEGEVEVSTNALEKKQEVEDTYEYARQGASGTVTIDVEDRASGVLNDIASKISNMVSRVHSIPVTTGGQASGGINTAQLRVPMFASGAMLNGIVKSATLTSQGLVGEAGNEAVIGMGRRAAVVPLSNRRYVRPFAHAVASEMGGSQRQVVNQYYVNGVEFREGSDGAEAVRTLVQAAGVAKRRRGM